jgi:hypothetical protein
MTEAISARRSAIESLILVRLLTVGIRGEPASKIKKDLESLLINRWGSANLMERIEATLASLEEAGLVTLVPGRTKKATSKFIPTTKGRRSGLDFLGVPELKPKTSWAVVKKTYLPACILGLPVSTDTRFKALSSEPNFQAVLLKQQYNLAIADLPKPDEATDALAWTLIGFRGEGQKFNTKNIKTALFNRALGNSHITDFKKAATQLLAKRLGAPGADSKELRDAVLRTWIDHEGAALALSDSVAHPEINLSVTLPFDLQAFAERVKSAARDCSTGRFGNNKVFISHVWKFLCAEPAFATMDLPAFKTLLAEANNARLLDLSRADLVQVMTPDDVHHSEIHYLNATFHFVRI